MTCQRPHGLLIADLSLDPRLLPHCAPSVMFPSGISFVCSVKLVFVLAPPRGHRKVSIEKESHFLDKSSPVPQDQPVARSEAWISGSEAAEGSQTLGTLAWNLGLPWKIHLLPQQIPFRNLALC